MHNAAWISPSSCGPAHTAPSSSLLLPIAAKENQYVNTHCKCWVLTLQGNVRLSLQFCSVGKSKKKKRRKKTVPSLSRRHPSGDEKHKQRAFTVPSRPQLWQRPSFCSYFEYSEAAVHKTWVLLWFFFFFSKPDTHRAGDQKERGAHIIYASSYPLADSSPLHCL